MSRTKIILLCCAAGLVGMAIGALGAARFSLWMADTAVLTRAEAELAVNVGILEKVRAGQSDDAAQLLEIQLDDALISIDAFASQGTPLQAATYDRLRRVRHMRDVSGYRSPHAEVADAAARALALSPGKSTHGEDNTN